jgi:hypothetical protein
MRFIMILCVIALGLSACKVDTGLEGLTDAITEAAGSAKFRPTGATRFHRWEPVNFMNGSHPISSMGAT